MAEMFYTADVLYPEWHDGDDTKRYVQQVSDYLFLLREGLGYTLNNLGMKNFNPEQINVLGEVIREPIQVQLTDQAGKLAEYGLTWDGLVSKVSSMDDDFVKSAGFTQTAEGFEFTILNNDEEAIITMSSDGMVIYDGNLTIKDRLGNDALYADTNGNLTLTGDIKGSTIWSIPNPPQSSSSTDRYIYMDDLNLRSMRGLDNEGFILYAGSEYPAADPYIGLVAQDNGTTKTWRTKYNTVTGNVTSGMVNSKAYIGYANGEVGFTYYDDSDISNIKAHWVNVTSTGSYICGKYNIGIGQAEIGLHANENGIYMYTSPYNIAITLIPPSLLHPNGEIKLIGDVTINGFTPVVQ